MRRAGRLLWAAALAGGLNPAHAEVADLDGFLQRLDAQRAEVKDFSAQFRQARFASMFGDTKLSTGSLKYRAPDEMLWEYLTPDHSFLRVGKTDVRFYFPMLEQIEVYTLDGKEDMTSLMASFNGGSVGLREQFHLEFHPPGTAEVTLGEDTVRIPDAPGIRMLPQSEGMKAQFSSIDFWVRPDTFVPCLLVIEEPTGDRTTFVFEDVRTNIGLDDAALDFNAPPGTEVVQVDTTS